MHSAPTRTRRTATCCSPDQARARQHPGLEILANDVRCTHGATIGHVDEEHDVLPDVARDLPRSEAQRFIVEGFFVPVLDRIPLEACASSSGR